MTSTATLRQLVPVVADAIQRAVHCHRFSPLEGEPCDGLNGCDVCLTLAAVSVLHAMGKFHDQKPLTEQQRRMLDFIESTMADRKIAPSYEEIAAHFQYKSLATVHEHLGALEHKGWIRREPGRARSIALVGAFG